MQEIGRLEFASYWTYSPNVFAEKQQTHLHHYKKMQTYPVVSYCIQNFNKEKQPQVYTDQELSLAD